MVKEGEVLKYLSIIHALQAAWEDLSVVTNKRVHVAYDRKIKSAQKILPTESSYNASYLN
jgi:hypothetical protein